MRLLAIVILLFSATAATDDDDEDDIVDLYAKDDAVVHMDHTNFDSLLYGKQHVWVVEFYNSWCGHCQLYAPTWHRVAQQTAKWDRVVKVGAINCARSENLALCRNFDIGGYPWIKMFKPLAKEGDIGKMKKHKPLEEMLDVIVDYVTEVQSASHPPLWPNLAPFQGSLSDIIGSPQPVHAIVLDKSAESHVGRQLILDLSSQEQRLKLVRVLQPPAGLTLKETARPLLVTYRRGAREVLASHDGLPPRRVFGDALRRMLGLAAEEVPANGTVSTADPVGRPAPLAADDGVFMVDLENTVGYALQHEVVGRKLIAGEQLAALREFVQLLVTHLPGRRSVMQALTGVSALLKGRQQISGEDLQQHLAAAEHRLPAHRPWRGCRGSQPQFRGYPCGLWSLFHTLTVHAHQQDPAAASVLPAIHGYVKHFFSCAHCSQHFQEMAAHDGLFNVTRADRAAVWLWTAHNKVNKRLAGDATEDPRHPKLQFPTRKQCQACFSGDEYYPAIVLSFLGSFYGQDVIQLDGLSTNAPVAASASADAAAARPPDAVVEEKSRNRVEAVARRVHQSRLAGLRIVPAPPGQITSGDVNLCVMLWTFSFLTLVLAFFLFRMKRRYKRKYSNAYGPFS
ncbi:sulfhydryl oxidase 2-like [Pollicipes pollicipes]|uniref:sulfhydryl oxidase 2-like n=1 Tax=Pollicipes pollicipes TaxID=41117 RepID=UPI00188514D0|nr:sulfhydryl oxidase 2-like [Pollicipes pollicipes]XP_037079869.1 sulfhydryl oxidase 2-like [Pollicipes pollicipes]